MIFKLMTNVLKSLSCDDDDIYVNFDDKDNNHERENFL